MSRIWFGGAPDRVHAGWDYLPSTTALIDLSPLLALAEEIWIAEPLAFPWDSIPQDALAPLTVDVDDLSLLDLAALSPCFEALSPVDQIRSTDLAVEGHLSRHFGTARNGETTTLQDRRDAKSIHGANLRIITRLETEAELRGDRDRVTIRTLSHAEIIEGADLGDFLERTKELFAEERPGVLFEVWGLRAAPGEATVGAVVAYRRDSLSVAVT